MGFFDRLKTDNKRIVSGDDMRNITLYSVDNGSMNGKGRIVDVDFTVTPQGKAINTSKWSVAFHIDEFSDITGVSETYKNWQGEFLNSQGETVKGYFKNTFQDKTLGYVVTNIEASKV